MVWVEVDGGDGPDHIQGGGNDILDGARGDAVTGGLGNDELTGSKGDGTIRGGPLPTRCSAAAATIRVGQVSSRRRTVVLDALGRCNALCTVVDVNIRIRNALATAAWLSR